MFSGYYTNEYDNAYGEGTSRTGQGQIGKTKYINK